MVIGNRFHRERGKYRVPDWWGNKPWHRGIPIEEQKDEKILKPR